VVPALNLRARFGFERAPYDLATRLLVVHAGGRTVGLVVDGAREFAAIDPASIHPPATALTGLSGRYLEGVANVGDRLILLLNLEAILAASDPVLEGHT
jgi:purine-binding chemotaxis protein CheW